MTTVRRSIARAAARTALGAGVVVGLGLVGLGAVGRGPAAPPDAPLPSRTFDLRETPPPARTPSSGSDTPRAPSSPAASPTRDHPTTGAVAAVRAPVPDPSRLRIPDLGVDAPVSRERVAPSGELVIPGDPHVVASWRATDRTTTQTDGVLVLAGHVDSNGRLGALHPLSQVEPGMQVVTSDAAGRAETWRIDALEVRRKDDLPAFPARGERRLAIVTCGGPVVEDERARGAGRTRGYRDNVVAWASPAP